MLQRKQQPASEALKIFYSVGVASIDMYQIVTAACSDYFDRILRVHKTVADIGAGCMHFNFLQANIFIFYLCVVVLLSPFIYTYQIAL